MVRQKHFPNEKFGFTDINGVSEVTGLSKSTLYKLVALAKIPHFKPTGKLLFRITEITEWIQQTKI